MPPIRICHVQVLPLMTGAQRAMIEIFRHVDRSRYELHVACQHPGPMSEELERLGIACHFVPSLRRPIAPWHDFRALFALERLFRRERFDLVHTHTSKPGMLGRWAACRAGVPWVVHHVHGFAFHEFSSPLATRLYRTVERWAGQLCDLVIFANHEEREMAVRERLLPAEKCLTVHNGIDLAPYGVEHRAELRRAFRAEHGIADDELLILFFGRLYEQKQPLILPAIADELLALSCAGQQRWRLLITGTGPLEARLRAAVAQSRAADRVSFAGWQPEPHRVFPGADLVLQPSLWEGLPLTLIEAQAAGVPVVASNIKGNREALTSQTGILCEAQNAAAYAQALAGLLAQPFERARMGHAGQTWVRQAFDGDVNMRRIAQLYDQHFFVTPAVPSRRAA